MRQNRELLNSEKPLPEWPDQQRKVPNIAIELTCKLSTKSVQFSRSLLQIEIRVARRPVAGFHRIFVVARPTFVFKQNHF
jgi:hypothetical protein